MLPIDDEKYLSLNLTKKEKRNRQLVVRRFKEEILLHNGLMYLLDGKIEYANKYLEIDSVHKRVSILFMSQNYSLLSNAFSLLVNGYELESLTLLRSVAERVILNLYFHDFPQDLEIYTREDGHIKFYSHLKSLGYKNYLQGVLERIENEGKSLDGARDNGWAKALHETLVVESSGVLHFNIKYGVAASVRGSRVIREPHFRIRSSNAVFGKIRAATLWTILSLVVSLEMPVFYWEDLTIRHAMKDLHGVDTLDQLDLGRRILSKGMDLV